MFSSNKDNVIFSCFPAFMLSKTLLNGKFQRSMRFTFKMHIEKYGRILNFLNV